MYNVKPVLFFIFLLSIFKGIAQPATKEVNGIITQQGQLLGDVSIIKKGTKLGVKTNSLGAYTIQVVPKDVLVFSHLGMKTVEVVIEEVTNILNIELTPKVEALDEVIVKERRPFTQKELLAAYPTNKRLIKTSRGIVDRDRSSFSMRIFDGKELIPVGTDFLYSLQNLYPQMYVDRKNPLDIIVSLGSGPVIFDLDGFVHESPPTFLSANEIDRIGILRGRSVGAISRYGSRGAAGVIIINTKSQTWMDDTSRVRAYDNSALRDSLSNIFKEPTAYTLEIPDYIKALNKATTESEAIRLFEKQQTKFGDSPYYLLDVAAFFKDKWNNEDQSNSLLQSVGDRFTTNVPVQRALAFRYEELGQIEKALKTYLTILNLKSKEAQSHYNLANAYAEAGNYKRALSVFARYELAVNELDSIPFNAFETDMLMTTAMANIVKTKSKELAIDPIEINGEIEEPSTRLVFEWNQSDAEFELQFEHDSDQNDIWTNSLIEEDELLKNEKIKGYSSKQFFLSDDSQGEWKININYMTNKSNTPVYLKVTTYFDYGKLAQSKVINVFRLQRENYKSHLLSINTKNKKVQL